MEALTGIKIVPSQCEDRIAQSIKLRRSGHPLLERLDLPDAVIGSPGKSAKLFSVRDSAATTLGTLPGSDAVTLAIKKMSNWTSLYSITPLLPPGFYRELARMAGVHIYNEKDEALYANRSYLTLCCNEAGPRTIRLPHVADVFDPFTDAEASRRVLRNSPANSRQKRQSYSALTRESRRLQPYERLESDTVLEALLSCVPRRHPSYGGQRLLDRWRSGAGRATQPGRVSPPLSVSTTMLFSHC